MIIISVDAFEFEFIGIVCVLNLVARGKFILTLEIQCDDYKCSC